MLPEFWGFLSPNGFDDFVAWHYNRSGTFSVKSAYHVEWGHQFGNMSHNMSSSSGGTNPIWHKIWKFAVPRKVKNIYMKGHAQCYPQWSQLLLTGILVMMNNFLFCHLFPEDLMHLFFECYPNRELWKILDLSLLILRLWKIGISCVERANYSWKGHFLGMPLVGLFEIILISVWCLSWIRRSVTHEENTPPIGNSWLSILAMCNNFTKTVPRVAPRKMWNGANHQRASLNWTSMLCSIPT